MDLGLGNTLLAGDPRLVDHIVGEVKSQGIFDQFRKECIADVDTKPAYQNLRTRVESSVNTFLSKQVWRADLNKNQLRETLRKHIHDAPYLDAGVERIVDQVVNPKVYSVFMPQIEDVVYKFLGIERPKNYQKNGPCGFKDLLPKDLDPVSPESDKNSLKDVSLDSVDANMKQTSSTTNEKNAQEDNEAEKVSMKNGNSTEREKRSEESSKPLGIPIAGTSLNNSGKSEDKTEEEEEDSPMFEPIDIMNLNESNISNDSHLSGISELTSHRSHTPDFSNETSRDNMDFSNQDSQFSKVSSDSRLSIVTDFGSSNHASTPLSDGTKEDKDRLDGKYSRDNFKAVREFETKSRDGKGGYEPGREDVKSSKRSSSSKETSRDGTESSRENQETRERSRDGESYKRGSRDAKRDKESRRKSSSDLKSEKKKSKERSDSSRDSERSKEATSSKLKDEKLKEGEKKETISGKEVKDLKDLYKEKIRELREKKELTEKEKLSKDARASKESKEKRDSSREGKRDSKDHKGGSSKSHNSSRSESKSSRSEKSSKNDSRGKKDERRYSKDHRSKNNGAPVAEASEKIDARKVSRSEKEERSDKSDARQRSLSKSSRSESGRAERRDSKGELDKKRRDDKKSKSKDDHSSLRKNPDDRRSTDRDGSNGSNGRSSHKTNSMANSGTTRTVSSSLQKETSSVSTSSSETSDSVAEKQNEKSVFSIDTKNSRTPEGLVESSEVRKLDVGHTEISLPIKKRPLTSEPAGIVVKKPKFAKNFHEAKRLMKIRRRMEKEKLRKQGDTDKSVQPTSSGSASLETAQKIEEAQEEDFRSVPDEERVQIIEVRDEEYDEPYPEIQSDFTLEERSQIILGGESIFTSDIIAKNLYSKSTLSDMELSIRQSLKEMISDGIVDEGKDRPKTHKSSESESRAVEPSETEDKSASELRNSEIFASISQIIGNSIPPSEVIEKPASPEKLEAEVAKESENRTKDEIAFETRASDDAKSFELEESTDAPSSILDESPKLEIVEDNEEIEEKDDRASDVNEKVAKASPVREHLGDAMEPERIAEEAETVESTEPEVREEFPATGQVEALKRSSPSVEEKNDAVDAEEAKVEEEKSLEEASVPEVKMEDDFPEEEEEQRDESSIGETREESSKEESVRTSRMESPLPSISREEEESEKFNVCDEPEAKGPETSTREESSMSLSDDEGPCLYFVQDNEKLERFARFMKSVENEDSTGEENPAEISSDDVSSSVSKEMAPPKPKRKYSTSPLTDILLNNSNNNNDAHKVLEAVSDEADEGANSLKKRRLGRPKKPKVTASLCTQQNLTNGENFVMPLSPESDVSATSEKTPSNPLKDEKSRPRGSNQRYTSDDLYKPRPLFSSSSRRSRRSNQA